MNNSAKGIGKSFAKCKSFAWMPGMADINGYRVLKISEKYHTIWKGFDRTSECTEQSCVIDNALGIDPNDEGMLLSAVADDYTDDGAHPVPDITDATTLSCIENSIAPQAWQKNIGANNFISIELQHGVILDRGSDQLKYLPAVTGIVLHWNGNNWNPVHFTKRYPCKDDEDINLTKAKVLLEILQEADKRGKVEDVQFKVR